MILNEKFDDKFLNLITLEFDKHRKNKKRIKDYLHYIEIDDKIIKETKEKYDEMKKVKEKPKLRIATYDWAVMSSHNSSEKYRIPIYYGEDKIADISISYYGCIKDIILNYKITNKFYDSNLKPGLLKFIRREFIIYTPIYEEKYFPISLDLQLQITRMKSIYNNRRYL